MGGDSKLKEANNGIVKGWKGGGMKEWMNG